MLIWVWLTATNGKRILINVACVETIGEHMYDNGALIGSCLGMASGETLIVMEHVEQVYSYIKEQAR